MGVPRVTRDVDVPRSFQRPVRARPSAAAVSTAHEFLDAAIDSCPYEVLRRARCGCEGIASAITCYAEALLCEDPSVNGVLAGDAPLALSTWAGRTGLSELPPGPGADDSRPGGDRQPWVRRVRVDHWQLRSYARAVHASTDAYSARLPGAAFDPACRDSPAFVLTALLLNASMRRGQIACLVALTCGEERR